MREWVARAYGFNDSDLVEETMSMAQIALKYYLGHRDELRRMQSEAALIAAALKGVPNG